MMGKVLANFNDLLIKFLNIHVNGVTNNELNIGTFEAIQTIYIIDT